MNKITYIFSGGRINKFNNELYAEEFFYGYKFLKNKYPNVSVIEFNITRKFIKNIEHKISKVFSLPLYIFSIVDKKNIQTIKETDKLILVSESAGFAALLPLIFLKKKYKIKTYMFVMGLYSKKINYKIFQLFHSFFISLLVSYLDRIYFLGIEEFDIAKGRVRNHNKLVYKPFHIDYQFWNNPDVEIENNKQILFIGNDGNRDFDLLVNVAKLMPEKEFTFVSSSAQIIDLKISNVNVIRGNWKDGISDFDLKEIYETSRLVILPLKKSTQPSGQSVALQSMSVGIPVLITKTEGFWDKQEFLDSENIFFEESSELELWVKKINYLYDNTSLLNKVSRNASLLIKEKFNIQDFNQFLLEEISL
jgi:glycosyltransferase involved in cell wall biosynthesis